MATKLHTESIQSPTDVDIVKQFILSNPSNTSFKLSLDTTGLTTNRIQTLQDKSGTIALLSDIQSTDELSEVLANGNNTGANDIVIDNGQRITAASGGGFISLRDFTTDGTWGMGSDNTYAESWVYGTTSAAEIGFGSSNYFGLTVSSNNLNIHGSGTANADYVYMTVSQVGVNNVSALSTGFSPVRIFPNNTLRNIPANIGNAGIVINNADTVTFNASVSNSTGISMDGGVIKTDDTLYTNQIGFSPKTGTFEGILSSSAVTADRSWELPDASGTIALESTIPITTADNGLTLNATTVEFGGSLIKNTELDLAGFDLFFTDGEIAIGTTSPKGTAGATPTLTIAKGDSGVGATGLPIDTTLIVENSDTAYIGILSPDNRPSGIYLGSPSDAFGTSLTWQYSNLETTLASRVVNGTVEIKVGNKNDSSLYINPQTTVVSEREATFDFYGDINLHTGDLTLIDTLSAFDGTLTRPSLTADRTYTLQDGSGTLAFLSDIPTGNTFGETYFVEPGGDDATGEVGNIDKPFQTILGAVDQAVVDALSNPLIYVFPGTYPEDSIQFDGSFFFTPGAIVTGRPGYHGTTGIVAVDTITKTFTTPGNFATHFNVPGKKFRVTGSTGNDGIYTVVSAVNNGLNTDVVVSEVVPSTIADGRLSDGMGIFYCGPVSSTYLLYGNAALNCKVYGELTVDRAETLDGDWPGGAIDIGQDGDMFVECHSITMEQGIGVYMQDNAKLTLTGEFFEVEKSGYGATVRDTSESVFIFQRIKHSGLGGGFIGNCFFIRQGSTGGFSGTCRVEAEELIADGGAAALQFANTLAGAIIYIEATDMDTSTWAINNQNHFGGEIKIVGNVRSPLGIFNTGSSGYLKFTGDLIANANSTSFNDINSGNVYINGDIYHDSTPTAISEMVKCDGGTLRINGKISNTTTGGFGINKTGGTLVLDTVKVIADSDSVTAATAQDIKVIHSLAVNTAVNANITNVILGSSLITDAGIE